MDNNYNDVNNPEVLDRVSMQLRAGSFDFLEISPFENVVCQDMMLGVFATPLFVRAENARTKDDMCVIDSWIVTYNGHTSFYNQECWPTTDMAAQQHIGRLAIEGHIKVVSEPYGSTNEGDHED